MSCYGNLFFIPIVEVRTNLYKQRSWNQNDKILGTHWPGWLRQGFHIEKSLQNNFFGLHSTISFIKKDLSICLDHSILKQWILTQQTKQLFETGVLENRVKKPILNLLQTFEGFKKDFYKTILKPFRKILFSNRSEMLW